MENKENSLDLDFEQIVTEILKCSGNKKYRDLFKNTNIHLYTLISSITLWSFHQLKVSICEVF